MICWSVSSVDGQPALLFFERSVIVAGHVCQSPVIATWEKSRVHAQSAVSRESLTVISGAAFKDWVSSKVDS
jgi:hypothetical protein